MIEEERKGWGNAILLAKLFTFFSLSHSLFCYSHYVLRNNFSLILLWLLEFFT